MHCFMGISTKMIDLIESNEQSNFFAVKLLNSLPKEALGAKSLNQKASKQINGRKIHPKVINIKTLSLSWEVSELQMFGNWNNKQRNFHCTSALVL